MLNYTQNLLIHKRLSEFFLNFAKLILQNGNIKTDNWIVIIAKNVHRFTLKTD